MEDLYVSVFFQHHSVVYIKNAVFMHHGRTTYVQSGRFYIGSTGIGVCKREFNRAAKLKQVNQMQSVHVELAIRYWSQFRNFSTFTIIVISPPPNLQIGVDSRTCFNCVFSGSAQFSIYHTNFCSSNPQDWEFNPPENKLCRQCLSDNDSFFDFADGLRTLGSVPDTHAFLYQAWSTIFDLASESKTILWCSPDY